MKIITLIFLAIFTLNVSAKRKSVTNMSKMEIFKVVMRLDKKCRKRAHKIYNDYKKMSGWIDKKRKTASKSDKNLYYTLANNFRDVVDLTFIQCQKYKYKKARQSFELAEHMLSFVKKLRKGKTTPIAEVDKVDQLPELGCDTPAKREVASTTSKQSAVQKISPKKE